LTAGRAIFQQHNDKEMFLLIITCFQRPLSGYNASRTPGKYIKTSLALNKNLILPKHDKFDKLFFA
jgi:hypothetical protein